MWHLDFDLFWVPDVGLFSTVLPVDVQFDLAVSRWLAGHARGDSDIALVICFWWEIIFWYTETEWPIRGRVVIERNGIPHHFISRIEVVDWAYEVIVWNKAIFVSVGGRNCATIVGSIDNCDFIAGELVSTLDLTVRFAIVWSAIAIYWHIGTLGDHETEPIGD